MNLDNITDLKNQAEGLEKEITPRMEALGPKLLNIFRNVLYYSSDEEVELSTDGRIFRIKHGTDIGIEIYEIIKEKKKFFKQNEYSDYILRMFYRDNVLKMIYSEDDIGTIIIVTSLAMAYLSNYFKTASEKYSLTLTAIKELESFLEGEYVNKNL